jgi:hypothetical protein
MLQEIIYIIRKQSIDNLGVSWVGSHSHALCLLLVDLDLCSGILNDKENLASSYCMFETVFSLKLYICYWVMDWAMLPFSNLFLMILQIVFTACLKRFIQRIRGNLSGLK